VRWRESGDAGFLDERGDKQDFWHAAADGANGKCKKTKGSKNILRLSEISLDKLLECGTLSLVENHASTQSGRFAFQGRKLAFAHRAHL
jgi:hypothetical protein